MTFIICVCGGSGSGKTYISRAIHDNLPYDSAVLSYDCYYKDQSALPPEERNKLNYDSPDMLDSELFLQHLKMLRDGKIIDVPQYEFASHTRSRVSKPFAPKKVIIVEGIMAMQLPRDIYDYVVYVDAESDIRLARRILRDTSLRGRTPESVINQYLTSVKPMHEKYVARGIDQADFVFNNSSNSGIDYAQMDRLISEISNRIEGK